MKPAPRDEPRNELGQNPSVLGAALALLTLSLYAPAAHHQFLVFFDDDFYITNNPHVNTGLSLGNARWAFTTFSEANWHPLTWLSHMLDCQLFGLNPGPHHLVNIVLHALNVLLLFLLLHKATGALWRSFFVATLFAVHPLNVETVAWVAERKSLLCTLFSLLTIAAYGRYVQRPDWKAYSLIVLAFALALMSKPMAVSLPLVLLLLDYWPLQRCEDLPLQRRWLRLTVEKLPLALLSAASCVITILAQRGVSTVAGTSELPISVRLENAVESYLAYIGKMFWPARLAVFYPHPWQALPWPEVTAATMILAGITIAAFYLHRVRYLAVGWFLFVITLIPVIGIVQVGRQAMADRYFYIPGIGLFIIIAWGLNAVAHLVHMPRSVPAMAAVALVLALALSTSRYLRLWQSGVELFTHARLVAAQPDFIIEEGLAESLAATGRYGEAIPHYKEACELSPAYARCHYKMADAFVGQGQLRTALEEYEFVARYADSKEIALPCLIKSGEILLNLGEYETARMPLAEALRMDPNNARAQQLLQLAVGQGNSKNR